jgi:transposase
MGKKLSEDLCWRVVYLHIDGNNEQDIATILYISQPMVSKIIKIFNKWGHVSNPFKISTGTGRRKTFSPEELKILKSLVKEKVDWYLDELLVEMENLTGKYVSVPTLWRSLNYCGITHKKVII